VSKSKIEWCDAVWNPTTGCSKVSEGCRNCYAERLWPRLRAMGNPAYKDRNFNDVACHPERLDQPMQWKKPRRIFVNSMSDLFHDDVPDEFIFKVFNAMANAQWINGHTFMVLTKRPERMKRIMELIKKDLEEQAKPEKLSNGMTRRKMTFGFPLKNVWLGVSVENQAEADERIPLLLQTPASVRFISAEPLLGPVDLSRYLGGFCHPGCIKDLTCSKHCGHRKKDGLDLVIGGGESGPGARPMHPDWVLGLRDQCQDASVSFFFKQWGEWKTFYDREKDDPDWGNIPEEKNGVQRLNINGGRGFHGDRVVYLKRVGKKKAGRELDGRTWDEMPMIGGSTC